MDDESLTTDPTLAAVERFLKVTRMSAKDFGLRALNDPTLVHEMRGGRECRRTTRARILEFIEAETRKATAA